MIKIKGAGVGGLTDEDRKEDEGTKRLMGWLLKELKTETICKKKGNNSNEVPNQWGGGVATSIKKDPKDIQE